jgi:hypothetical protein
MHIEALRKMQGEAQSPSHIGQLPIKPYSPVPVQNPAVPTVPTSTSTPGSEIGDESQSVLPTVVASVLSEDESTISDGDPWAQRNASSFVDLLLTEAPTPPYMPHQQQEQSQKVAAATEQLQAPIPLKPPTQAMADATIDLLQVIEERRRILRELLPNVHISFSPPQIQDPAVVHRIPAVSPVPVPGPLAPGWAFAGIPQPPLPSADARWAGHAFAARPTQIWMPPILTMMDPGILQHNLLN